MYESEYQEIKIMVDRLISFIRWKGASFESKQNKVIKELSLIKKYCETSTKQAYLDVHKN